jgi:KAP family P-loop domain
MLQHSFPILIVFGIKKDSIKTFFDIEGIVYVIGMDSGSINSIIKEKYGEGSDVKKAWITCKKIVQLPFKVPIWKEKDISNLLID